MDRPPLKEVGVQINQPLTNVQPAIGVSRK